MGVGRVTVKTDEELMAAFAAGDDGAVGELYERYRPALRARAMRTRSASDADDVVQQTFVRLFQARHSYRLGEPVRPWLHAIANNVRRDSDRSRMRRRETTVPVEAIPENDGAFVQLERAQEVALLREALDSLASPTRAVVVQHWLEEKRLCDLAEHAGLPAVTMRVRAHRAMQALRDRMEQLAA